MIGAGYAVTNEADSRNATTARHRRRYIIGTIKCEISAQPSAAKKMTAQNKTIPTIMPTSLPAALFPEMIIGSRKIANAAAAVARKSKATSHEKRKRLFPSHQNSFHGSTIAARLRTMQSVKMKAPRALNHDKTTMIAKTIRKSTAMSATTQG